MIDIHSHILFGIDDGAGTLTESIAMAKIAYEDGIRHIIATPHYTLMHANTRDIVAAKIIELREALQQQAIDIHIHSGCELRLENTEFVHGHINGGLASLLGESSRYVLLEQRWKEYDPETPALIRWFMERGIRTIIPHPERHPFFRDDSNLILSLIAAGAWTQVSVDSLLGKNKEEAKSFGEWLVSQNACHVLATDAHNVNRKPNLSEGFKAVEKLVGSEQVNQMKQRAQLVLEV